MISSGNGHSSDRVEDLLAEWVERHESGEEISVGSLCRDAPELASTVSSLVASLKETEWLFEDTAVQPRSDPGDGEDNFLREKILSLADSLSVQELLERVGEIRLVSADNLTDLAEGYAKADTRQLAERLLQREGITLFQLGQLCRNRGAALVFDRYLLLDRIGEGGMGRVYKALHRTMNRVVALKVIHPRIIGSREAASRFRREVVAAARLDSPQIVRSFDAGESHGRNYLVMEYVEGIDLASLVERDGPLPVDQVVSYVLQVARALACAHEEGIVHRDVKPSNLLLDSQGSVKVLDLGLARIADTALEHDRKAAVSLTGSGDVMGTVDYLAPEQARDSRTADERSDIYSLGCTLYTLLHGRPMYDGKSIVERLLAHQNAPVPSLGAGYDGVSRRLEGVFQRMVAKRPRDRFQGMNELVAALSDVASDSGQSRRFYSKFFGPRWMWCAVTLMVAAVTFVVLNAWGGSSGEVGNPSERRDSKVESQTSGASRPSPPPAVAPFDEEQARTYQEAWAEHLGVPVEYENSIGMRFRLVPPGEFRMGTPQDKAEALFKTASPLWRDEHRLEAPARRVRLTRAFYLAQHEVTQEQYKQIAGTNPSHFTEGGRGEEAVHKLDTRLHPVENVSWLDTKDFCNALGRREGMPSYYVSVNGLTRVNEREPTGYRLATEAEWEFACRAGSEGTYSFDGPGTLLKEYATFSENADGRTHPVASRRPNAFGMYDMQGNVSEWCYDGYGPYEQLPTLDPRGPADITRAHRGGCWMNPRVHCRPATRSAHTMSYSSHFIGFRLALSVEAVREK